MSIQLTRQVLKVQGLSQSAKHILTVLCFASNEKYEAYSSIKKLTQDCSCSIKTVERSLKELRDKNYLIYTGKLAPNSKSIPIYRINLTDPQNGGGSNLRTDNLSFTHPQNGYTDRQYIIDNKIYIKDENFLSENARPSNEDGLLFYYYKNHPELEIPKELEETMEYVKRWLIKTGWLSQDGMTELVPNGQ